MPWSPAAAAASARPFVAVWPPMAAMFTFMPIVACKPHRRWPTRFVPDGGSAQALAFDVTDSQAVADALTPLVEHQPIQILVNNAGIHDDAVFPGMRAEQWHRVIDVSVNGFFNVTQPLMMPMIRSRWGRIINVSSIAALTGNRGPGELFRCQGRAQFGHQVAGTGSRQPRHHRQRGCARHYRHPDERIRVRRPGYRAHGADETRRYARPKSPT